MSQQSLIITCQNCKESTNKAKANNGTVIVVEKEYEIKQGPQLKKWKDARCTLTTKRTKTAEIRKEK